MKIEYDTEHDLLNIEFLANVAIDDSVETDGIVIDYAEDKRIVAIEVFTGQVNSYQIYCGCSGSQHDQACRVSQSIRELRQLSNPISEGDLVDAAVEFTRTAIRGRMIAHFVKASNIRTSSISSSASWLVRTKIGSNM
jgi:uncharacterized protein YuzE